MEERQCPHIYTCADVATFSRQADSIENVHSLCSGSHQILLPSLGKMGRRNTMSWLCTWTSDARIRKLFPCSIVGFEYLVGTSLLVTKSFAVHVS